MAIKELDLKISKVDVYLLEMINRAAAKSGAVRVSVQPFASMETKINLKALTTFT